MTRSSSYTTSNSTLGSGPGTSVTGNIAWVDRNMLPLHEAHLAQRGRLPVDRHPVGLDRPGCVGTTQVAD